MQTTATATATATASPTIVGAINTARPHKSLDKMESLLLAVQQGDLTLVKQLLDDGVDVHFDQERALFIAIERGDLDMVRALVEAGANFHINNDFPLIVAIGEKMHLIAKYLLEVGAEIDQYLDTSLLRYLAKQAFTHDDFEAFRELGPLIRLEPSEIMPKSPVVSMASTLTVGTTGFAPTEVSSAPGKPCSFLELSSVYNRDIQVIIPVTNYLTEGQIADQLWLMYRSGELPESLLNLIHEIANLALEDDDGNPVVHVQEVDREFLLYMLEQDIQYEFK